MHPRQKDHPSIFETIVSLTLWPMACVLGQCTAFGWNEGLGEATKRKRILFRKHPKTSKASGPWALGGPSKNFLLEHLQAVELLQKLKASVQRAWSDVPSLEELFQISFSMYYVDLCRIMMNYVCCHNSRKEQLTLVSKVVQPTRSVLQRFGYA